MAKFEVTASISRIVTFEADNIDDAKQKMYEYLGEIGMDANAFCFYVEAEDYEGGERK